ncbi:MAG: hypothetical protein LC689_08320, partial [Myxococcales bacterium]|nr:hypothetical protein [Myxococcales bacterium]
NKPCENAAKLPRTLDFRTVDGRRVIEVRDQQGSCEPGAEMSNITLALFEARDGKLYKIFETPLLEEHRVSSGAMLVQRCEVFYEKGITLRCGESQMTWTYEKASGKYVAR